MTNVRYRAKNKTCLEMSYSAQKEGEMPAGKYEFVYGPPSDCFFRLSFNGTPILWLSKDGAVGWIGDDKDEALRKAWKTMWLIVGFHATESGDLELKEREACRE